MKILLIVITLLLAAFLIYGLVVIINAWRFWNRADWIIKTYRQLVDTYENIPQKEIKGKYYTIKFATKEEFTNSFEVAIRHAMLFYRKYENIYKDSPDMQRRVVDLKEIYLEI